MLTQIENKNGLFPRLNKFYQVKRLLEPKRGDVKDEQNQNLHRKARKQTTNFKTISAVFFSFIIT